MSRLTIYPHTDKLCSKKIQMFFGLKIYFPFNIFIFDTVVILMNNDNIIKYFIIYFLRTFRILILN